MLKTASLAILLVSILVSACGPIRVQTDPTESPVFKRALEFQNALNSNNVAVILEMADPRDKQAPESYKAAFVAKISDMLKQAQYFSEKTNVVMVREKYAFTQAIYSQTVLYEGEEVLVRDCEMTFWLKYPDNWYWYISGMKCNEIFNITSEQIQFWTHHLP